MKVQVMITDNAGNILHGQEFDPCKPGANSVCPPGGLVADGYHLSDVQVRAYGKKVDVGEKSEIQKAAERGFDS